MSSATLKRAVELARELPASERAALAHDLLARPDGPSGADIRQAWGAEMANRLDELETGSARTIDAEEAVRRIDTRLRRGCVTSQRSVKRRCL